MIVRHLGKKLSLDPSAVLGAGGEATVFALDEHTAIKVFHDPSRQRATKLEAALQRTWPASVVAPLSLVHDAKGSAVIGFAMPRVPAHFEPLSALFRRSARRAAGVRIVDVVRVLTSLASTLEALHSVGVVVGDLNDQNELWHRTEGVRLIDADSFQHDGSPCIVGTESYLAPELHGVDLQAAPAFRPAHDRYAFAVLAFRALLCVHPFGGTHPSVRTLVDRIAQRLWVLDPSVRFPDKIALPAATLSPRLLSYFHAVFVDGARPALPVDEMAEHVVSLSSCPSCGEEAPRSLAVCPVCAAARPRPAVRTTSTRCLGEVLYATDGTFLCASVARDASDAVIAVADENGRTIVVRVDPGRHAVRFDLGARDPSERFAILSNGLLIRARGELLDVVDPTTGSTVVSTSTTMFGGVPAFAAAGDQLLRIAGGIVLRGALRGSSLIERPVTSALEKQTWLAPSPNGEPLLGAHRVFRHVTAFRIARGAYHELPAPRLGEQESLLDLTLQSDGANTLLLRATMEQGVAYTRVDLLDSRGALACSSRSRAEGEPTRSSVQGRAFRGDVILHPTDDGILHESVRFGAIGDVKPLDDTEPFVSSQSTLLHHPRGLLVMNAAQIFLLTPR